jgi:chemotaxis protein histidine kinase CheA
MKIDLKPLRKTFFQEAGEQVAQMAAGLLTLAAGDVNPELVNALVRRAHFLRGAAGTFGLAETAEFTHAMEGLLDRMRSGRVEPDRTSIDLLLEAMDVLAALLDSARRDTAAPANVAAVRGRLTSARWRTPPDPASARELRRLDAEVFLQGMNPARVRRELCLLRRAAN